MLPEGLLYEEDVILTWMRDRFLQDLALGRKPNSANAKDGLTRLGLNPYFTYPAIALFEPCPPPGEDEEENAQRMERMREELQQRAFRGSAVFMDGRHRIGLLFSWKSAGQLEAVQAQVAERFGLPVSVGVGAPCALLGDVHHSYRQASRALQDTFYRGTGHVIRHGELPRYAAPRDDTSELEQALLEGLKAADADADIEAAVDAYYDALLAEGPIDIQAMYELTARLLVGTEKKLLANANYESACNRCEIMSVVKLRTLREIKAYVARFLAGVRSALLSERKESHRSIIKKTIQHMEQDYRGASLQTMAQKVYMTPTYLSLLFKLNTGTTFIEHLTRIRIEKAKSLLAGTHYKNYEIAELVGYHDPRYFSQIFKRKVGLSPTEYRESAGKA
ncbi:helix-turn-helix domain-containing protein [Paenibacillus sp. GCM10023250]|uniref:helix-turn-helix domain-containing protein n=1 Tax=Paenibacillus sp. GCM10023250 TaxID=3252648 RepID=UPI003614E2EB